MMLITHPITWWLGVITHPKRRQIYTRIIETNSYACLTIFASRLNRTVINCIPSAHKFALKTTGGSSWYKHSNRYWAAKKRQLFDLNFFIAFYYICVLNNMNIWGFFSHKSTWYSTYVIYMYLVYMYLNQGHTYKDIHAVA